MANSLTTYVVFNCSTTACTALPEPAPKLPFFLDPEQIRELTPHINWNQRVGDRIRSFELWGRQLLGKSRMTETS
jgi:hypothetical protein